MQRKRPCDWSRKIDSTYDGKDYDRWSGVIVSEDGYILTCGHADQLPGEQFTVRLSDGRDADAVALGTNPITDVGLVKITTPGSWPFAEIAESSTLKPGDPLVVAGIRPSIRGNGQQNAYRELTQRLCNTLCTCCGAENTKPIGLRNYLTAVCRAEACLINKDAT